MVANACSLSSWDGSKGCCQFRRQTGLHSRTCLRKTTTTIMKTKRKGFPEKRPKWAFSTSKKCKAPDRRGRSKLRQDFFLCQSDCREFKSCVIQCVLTGEGGIVTWQNREVSQHTDSAHKVTPAAPWDLLPICLWTVLAWGSYENVYFSKRLGITYLSTQDCSNKLPCEPYNSFLCMLWQSPRPLVRKQGSGFRRESITFPNSCLKSRR